MIVKMKKFFNKSKDYIVGITSNNQIEFVQVKAKNKKEAANIVSDVLTKCELFPFVSRDDFSLVCKRIKSSL